MAEPQTKGVPDGWAVVDEPTAQSPTGENGNQPDPNTIGTTLRHWWANANPVLIGQLLPFPKVAGGSGTDHPFNPLKIMRDMQAVKEDADARWAKGDHVGAAAKYLESITPIVGPVMSKWGDEAQQGKWAALGGDVAGVVTAMKEPAMVARSGDAMKGTAQTGRSALVSTLDAIKESGGNPLKFVANLAGKAADSLRQTPEATVAAPLTQPAPMEAPLDMTRRLKAEWLEQHGGLDAARQAITPPEPTPVASPAAATPQRATPPASGSPPPPVAPAGAPTGQALMQMIQSGQLTPPEANKALTLLQQGVAAGDVEAQILAARPSPASVAPAAAAPPVESAAPPAAPAVAQSPIQKMTNIRPGVPPAPAQVQSAIGIAAKRAKVTMSPAEVDMLAPYVAQGMPPEEAVAQLPAIRLQRNLGLPTDAEARAAVVERNRTGRWKGSPNGKQIAAKADTPE